MNNFNPNQIPHFLRVKKEDVTLKFIFDLIRNIGIAAFVFSMGPVVYKGEPLGGALAIPYSQLIVGILLALFGFILMVLNVMQATFAAMTSIRFNKWFFVAFSLFIQLTIARVFFEQVHRLAT